ncbi:MAG: SWIM zinc finger family protein, partial [Bacteroidia bacterium]|nr:SWIM zinc finger family protein [Bacteroidia bacterium]
MNIPLDQFEQVIDEVILKRGLTYYRKGLVEGPQELSPGLFEAIVEGNELYRVTVTINKGVVTRHTCTCPYDMGPVCKHVVALLFALQEEELDLPKQKEKTALKRSGKPKKKGRKTVAEQVDEVIKELSPDAVLEFIREECLNEPAFRRRFLGRFSYQLKKESKAMYAQQIRGILQSAKGQHGFIEWNRVGQVGRAIYDLLNTAEKHLKQGRLQTAMWIACAVLEEMTKALQFADDSDGDIGGGINGALDIMGEIVKGTPSEPIRKALFDYTVNAFQKELFEGWDWHTGMMILAADLMRGKQEAENLLQLMETMSYSEYASEVVEELMLEVLKKSGREAEAETFLADHLNNPRIRELAIRESLNTGDLIRAGTLAREGINLDEKSKPGLADTWKDYLLQIALKQGDRNAVIHWARYLFWQSNRGHTRYYEILQSQIDTTEWPAYVDQLMAEMENHNQWRNHQLLEWICIREARWEKLLTLITSNSTLYGIRHI